MPALKSDGTGNAILFSRTGNVGVPDSYRTLLCRNLTVRRRV